VSVLGAVGTLAITRLLGPTDYGSYASAIAAVALLGAAADFGFSFMISRDAVTLAASSQRPMLRAAYEVATAWSALLTLVVLALALSAGLSTDRGLVLLVLAPSVAFNGLNPARAFLIVTNRTRVLALIDVAVTAVQVAAAVTVAALGLGPVAVGVAVCVGSIVDSIVVAVAAARTLERSSDPPFSRRLLVRRSIPLGLVAIMTRVYLTIDLVLLGWLVTGPRLGEYAAAAKGVAVLAGVSGTVMSGALPALSAAAGSKGELEQLMGRIWHWLVVGPFAAFVAVALFANPIVRLALGRSYAEAAPLLRILALAGCISVLSNLTGNLMVVFRRNRAMIVQNGFAIAFNVGGNLILVPSVGVTAAAWMTVATEALVCGGSIISLRGRIRLRGLVSVSVRPTMAIALASGAAVLLIQTPWLAALASAATFVGLLSLLGGWPVEFRIRRSATAQPPT
jgi:O-antigen/teichoic acid export membrane protein